MHGDETLRSFIKRPSFVTWHSPSPTSITTSIPDKTSLSTIMMVLPNATNLPQDQRCQFDELQKWVESTNQIQRNEQLVHYTFVQALAVLLHYVRTEGHACLRSHCCSAYPVRGEKPQSSNVGSHSTRAGLVSNIGLCSTPTCLILLSTKERETERDSYTCVDRKI